MYVSAVRRIERPSFCSRRASQPVDFVASVIFLVMDSLATWSPSGTDTRSPVHSIFRTETGRGPIGGAGERAEIRTRGIVRTALLSAPRHSSSPGGKGGRGKRGQAARSTPRRIPQPAVDRGRHPRLTRIPRPQRASATTLLRPAMSWESKFRCVAPPGNEMPRCPTNLSASVACLRACFQL